jgi:LmbE family N-acetylglucosaminyl deacetylase
LCAVYPDAANRFIHPELVTDEGLESWRTNEVWMIAAPHSRTYVDVTDTFDAELAALRAHSSQTAHMPGLADRVRSELADNAQTVGLPEARLAEIFRSFHTGRS